MSRESRTFRAGCELAGKRVIFGMNLYRFAAAAFFTLATMASAFDQPGPYPVTESVVSVPREDGPAFDSLFFYPGDAAALAGGPARFPGVVFAHGFLSPPELYRQTCRHLASHGFLVLAPRSALEPFPDHSAYAEDIRACLTYLESGNGTPGSLLFQRVATDRLGLTGHSMGGGASVLAASRDDRVRALAPIAAAETRPSAIAAAPALAVPTMYLTGSLDAITPSFRHTAPMTEAMTAPWVWMDLRGGSHCGFVSFPLPAFVCDEAAIPLARQLELTHRYLTAFFKLHLEDDVAAWAQIWGVNARVDASVRPRYQPDVTITPTFQRNRIGAGNPAMVSLEVVNRGLEPATFQIDTLSSIPATTTPSTLANLAPGAAASVNVSWTQPTSGPRRVPVVIQIRNTETQVGAHAVSVGTR